MLHFKLTEETNASLSRTINFKFKLDTNQTKSIPVDKNLIIECYMSDSNTFALFLNKTDLKSINQSKITENALIINNMMKYQASISPTSKYNKSLRKLSISSNPTYCGISSFDFDNQDLTTLKPKVITPKDTTCYYKTMNTSYLNQRLKYTLNKYESVYMYYPGNSSKISSTCQDNSIDSVSDCYIDVNGYGLEIYYSINVTAMSSFSITKSSQEESSSLGKDGIIAIAVVLSILFCCYFLCTFNINLICCCIHYSNAKRERNREEVYRSRPPPYPAFRTEIPRAPLLNRSTPARAVMRIEEIKRKEDHKKEIKIHKTKDYRDRDEIQNEDIQIQKLILEQIYK